MKNNNTYHDFSALDAPEHLSNSLRHFFSDTRHTYKFGIAKRHYDELRQQGGFAEAKNLFKIISGTNLITNKIITSYKTDQGYRYLIKKDFLQDVQRTIRNDNRTQRREERSNLPTPRSPFLDAMKDLQDTSDEDNSKSDGDIHVTYDHTYI